MKYVAYYMLFSISSFLIMAFFDLPDRFFGIMFLIIVGVAVFYGIKKWFPIMSKKK